MRVENEQLRKENNKIKEENCMIKKEIQSINTRLEQLEKEKRRNNIVIQGLSVNNNTTEIKEDIEKFLYEKLGVNTKVKSAYRMGPKMQIVAPESYEVKREVMKNKIKLRNIQGNKIFINNDQTKQEREIDAQIRVRARTERSKGRRVRNGYQKLFIDEEEWKWNKVKGVLEMVERGEPALVNNAKN